MLHAPTGFGKTLAVWLGPLSDTLSRVPDEKEPPCEVLWLTPLRALAHDTLRAIREPLTGLGVSWLVEARTGDTSSYRKAKQREKFPYALVTTPESLSLLLTHPETYPKLKNLRTVVLDEWHELLGTKRGVQAELCLARLRKICPDLQIWGLSATLGNLTEAARPLSLGAPDFQVVSADLEKKIEFQTMIPREMESFPWAGHIGTRLVGQVLAQLEKAKTTLLFTNTRSQTENWFQQISSAKPEWENQLALHHGSLGREERAVVETGLREGTWRCVVCTASLDLGVDFSPVDQVIQVGSPKGIARLTQRAGRCGHAPGQVSRIHCVPTNALELVEFAATRAAWTARHIESRVLLEKPLDVLVQHLVTLVIGQPAAAEELRREVLSTHTYRNLTEAEWLWALDFIQHGGPLKNYPQYRKVVEKDGLLAIADRRLASQHRLNMGTITSDSQITVAYASGRSLGSVEESFASKLRVGQQFIFAGKGLQLVRFHKLTATVKNATGPQKGQIPSWQGGRMPLSSELSAAVAGQLKNPSSGPEMTAVAPILAIQKKWSAIPSLETLLIEFTTTREGQHLFLYPFGGRLAHEGIGALAAYRLSQEIGESVHVTQNDYGFCLTANRGVSLDEALSRKILSPENLLPDLMACMNTAEMALRQFRAVARVAGLLPPDLPGKRRPQGDLQVSARLLYEVLDRYDPGNLLLEQARREILENQLELTRLSATLELIEKKPLQLVESERLSPFAFPLWADRLSAYLPAGDAQTRLEKMLVSLQK